MFEIRAVRTPPLPLPSTAVFFRLVLSDLDDELRERFAAVTPDLASLVLPMFSDEDDLLLLALFTAGLVDDIFAEERDALSFVFLPSVLGAVLETAGVEGVALLGSECCAEVVILRLADGC